MPLYYGCVLWCIALFLPVLLALAVAAAEVVFVLTAVLFALPALSYLIVGPLAHIIGYRPVLEYINMEELDCDNC